jgi:hypothetical protein
MYETKKEKVLHPKKFIWRLLKHILFGIALIVLSLLIGMAGYSYFENMNFIDSYLNAAMILSGMGEIKELSTEGGKIFAATYALFCGILFLVVIAICFAPVIHRTLHKFHMDDQ